MLFPSNHLTTVRVKTTEGGGRGVVDGRTVKKRMMMTKGEKKKAYIREVRDVM